MRNAVAVFSACSIAAALMVALAAAQQRFAQSVPTQNASPPKQSVEQPTTTAQPMPIAPPQNVIVMMIRETMVALNQANQTGNYTVLQDLGSPDFQRANTAVRLGEIFAHLRKKGINLSPVVLVSPVLDEPATVTQDRLLKIFGHFPTKPLRINFRMMFQVVNGHWRMFGLGVNSAPYETTKPAAQKN